MELLFSGGYEAAGYGFACETVGVINPIVGHIVDDEGFATEDAVGPAGSEGEISDVEGSFAGAVGADEDVGQVASVLAERVERTVLLVLRVEVGARGGEVRGLADGVGVEINGVLARGQIFERELDPEVGADLLESGGSGIFALAVAKFGDEAFGAVVALVGASIADDPAGREG